MTIKFNDAGHLKTVFEDGGFDRVAGEFLEFQDVLNTSNAGPLLPKVVTQVIKESQEPLLIGERLLDRLDYRFGQQIVFPAIGAMVAEDIAEGEEYPEVQPQIGGATVTATDYAGI